MKRGRHKDGVSSFTTIKGAMIEETYAVFAGWDLAQSKRQNVDRLRAETGIDANTATWLRDMAWAFNCRFEPNDRDRAPVLLAQHGCDLDAPLARTRGAEVREGSEPRHCAWHRGCLLGRGQRRQVDRTQGTYTQRRRARARAHSASSEVRAEEPAPSAQHLGAAKKLKKGKANA